MIVFLIPLYGEASLSIGGAMSSATSGRVVPGLYGAYKSESLIVSLMSTGVQTPIYYHSAYQVGLYFFNFHQDQFWWGDLHGSVGLSVYYASRGYRETEDSKVERNEDYVVGPSFRARWMILDPAFLLIDGTYGIRNLNFLILSSQELVTLALGVEF